MKKIILLILLVFVNGCSDTHKLNITNTQDINYNDINLIQNDFEQVINSLNQMEFKAGDIGNVTSRNLKIVTKDEIYNFKVSNDIIYYEENNKTYISENINNLYTALNEIENKYTDFSFLKITYDKCNINDNNTLIKINNTNNCLILNTSKILYNFRINSVMSINEEITETALLYQKDEIKSNSVLIKLDILGTYKTKISFDTEYNYTISILPIYNENQLQLNFSSNKKGMK